jgi:hypothetical protein
MKVSRLVGLVSLFAIAAVANAATPSDLGADHDNHGNGSVQLRKFTFFCEFGQALPPPPPVSASSDDLRQPGAPICEAVATVIGYGREKMNIADIDMTQNGQNRMAIACHNELVYADGALLFSGRKAVKITGENGFTPAIVIPRHHGPAVDDTIGVETHQFEAFLRLQSSKAIPGYCEVRSRPLGSSSDEMTLR